MLEVLSLVSHYYEKTGMNTEVAELNLLRLEHSYYKHDSIAVAVDNATKFATKFGELEALHPACLSTNAKATAVDPSKVHPGAASGKPSIAVDPETPSPEQNITDCASFIYAHGSEKEKVRAILCHITYHAIHDRFEEGRDLLLMSKLQDSVATSNHIPNMILFNRMMVTLGLCAFRKGKIWEAFQCLSEIAGGRLRELLAQGLNKYGSDKNSEQEKAERRRQTPYHQQLNVDLIEATHLICAMLIEVPNMAKESAGGENRKRAASKYFRKQVEIYNRQIFTGPPENTRDHIMAATKALQAGDWKNAYEMVANLNVWQLVPGEGAKENIQKVLMENIKEQALRTFLFTYSNNYDSLALESVVEKFDLEASQVHSIVSKLMFNRELLASWDGPTSTIVMHRVHISKLQNLALRYSEKVAQLVESNEKLLDAQSGTYGFSDRDFSNTGGSWNNNRRGNYGGNKYNTRRRYNNGGKGGGGKGGRGGRKYNSSN